MDLRVLQFCEAVGRLGSFTRAAEEIHIAQPALSTAIGKLERELGVSLFFRLPRGAIPTPEGQIMIERAGEIFEKIDAARREIADTAELRSGTIRVGFPPMYGLRYFPTLISGFSARFPGIEVSAIQGSATEIQERLSAGTIDIGILESRRVDESWRSVLIGNDEMVLALPRSHPLAKFDQIKPKWINGLPMVVLTAEFLQRQLLDKFCRQHGVTYRKIMECNFVHMTLQAVADGHGGATLLRSLVNDHSELVGLSFPDRFYFKFRLCWRRDRYVSKAMDALVAMATAK